MSDLPRYIVGRFVLLVPRITMQKAEDVDPECTPNLRHYTVGYVGPLGQSCYSTTTQIAVGKYKKTFKYYELEGYRTSGAAAMG